MCGSDLRVKKVYKLIHVYKAELAFGVQLSTFLFLYILFSFFSFDPFLIVALVGYDTVSTLVGPQCFEATCCLQLQIRSV